MSSEVLHPLESDSEWPQTMFMMAGRPSHQVPSQAQPSLRAPEVENGYQSLLYLLVDTLYCYMYDSICFGSPHSEEVEVGPLETCNVQETLKALNRTGIKLVVAVRN
jgi:hypothetical protein